jgi:hypothetical protein
MNPFKYLKFISSFQCESSPVEQNRLVTISTPLHSTPLGTLSTTSDFVCLESLALPAGSFDHASAGAKDLVTSRKGDAMSKQHSGNKDSERSTPSTKNGSDELFSSIESGECAERNSDDIEMYSKSAMKDLEDSQTHIDAAVSDSEATQKDTNTSQKATDIGQNGTDTGHQDSDAAQSLEYVDVDSVEVLMVVSSLKRTGKELPSSELVKEDTLSESGCKEKDAESLSVEIIDGYRSSSSCVQSERPGSVGKGSQLSVVPGSIGKGSLSLSVGPSSIEKDIQSLSVEIVEQDVASASSSLLVSQSGSCDKDNGSSVEIIEKDVMCLSSSGSGTSTQPPSGSNSNSPLEEVQGEKENRLEPTIDTIACSTQKDGGVAHTIHANTSALELPSQIDPDSLQVKNCVIVDSYQSGDSSSLFSTSEPSRVLCVGSKKTDLDVEMDKNGNLKSKPCDDVQLVSVALPKQMNTDVDSSEVRRLNEFSLPEDNSKASQASSKDSLPEDNTKASQASSKDSLPEDNTKASQASSKDSFKISARIPEIVEEDDWLFSGSQDADVSSQSDDSIPERPRLIGCFLVVKMRTSPASRMILSLRDRGSIQGIPTDNHTARTLM